MKKRLLSMLLAMVMVLGMLPVSVLAETSTTVTNTTGVQPEAETGYVYVKTAEVTNKVKGDLSCDITPGHTHTDECYELSCGHIHSEFCFENQKADGEWKYCSPENNPSHWTKGIFGTDVHIGYGCWLGGMLLFGEGAEQIEQMLEDNNATQEEIEAAAKRLLELRKELAELAGTTTASFNYYYFEQTNSEAKMICGHHTDACYSAKCGMVDNHVHTDDCYEWNDVTTYTWTRKADANQDGTADDSQKFTVVYTDNGEGVFDTETTANLSVGDATPAFKGSTKRLGYTFDGWTPSVAATVNAAMADKNCVITYTASWTKNGKVTVTFNSNGGSSVPQQEILKGEKAVKPENPTKALCIFQGWYLNEAEYDFNTAVNNSITLVAKWGDDKNNNGKLDDDESRYTVVYTDGVDGKAFEPQTKQGLLEGLDTPAFQGTPSYSGHVFSGWEPDVSDTVDAKAAVSGVITYTATWEADSNSNGVPDEDEIVTITVVGDGTVTIGSATQTAADGAKSYVYDSKTESGVTFTATPGDNDYVASITGADTDTLSHYGSDRSYAYIAKTSTTVTFAEKTLAAKETIGKVTCVSGTTVDQLKQNIFNAVVDTAKSVPVGVAWDDLTYQYQNALGAATDFNDFTPSLFLLRKSVTLFITWPGDARYPAASLTITVALTSGKSDTTITVAENKKTQTVVYGSYGKQDLIDAYGLVITDENGTEINYTADDIEIQCDTVNALLGYTPYTLNASDNPYTLTVKYLGNNAYSSSKIHVELIVVKAESKVTVTSGVYRYNEVPSDDIITVTSKGKNVDIKTIDFLVGLDVHDETQLTSVAKVALPSKLLVALGDIDLTLSLPELKTALENVAKINDLVNGVLIDSTTIDNLIRVLSAVQKYLPENVELQIELASDLGIAQNQNVGLYLVGAVTADTNYETSFGVGCLLVYPNGIRANLAWVNPDDNGLVVQPHYDLSAYVKSLDEATFNNLDLTRYPEPSKEEAAEHLKNLFIGVNLDGELVLTQDQNDLKLGTYTEIAYITNWDNQMYYALPLVRSLTIVPNLAHVKFVNSPTDLTENNDRLFTYDGKAKEMPVAVNGKYMAPGNGLTVTYIGLSGDAEGYNSTTAPSKAGAYTVIATYAEEKEGEYVVMGGAVGAMVIQKGELSFALESTTVSYDGEGHFATVINPLGADYMGLALDRVNNIAYVKLPQDLKSHMDEIIDEAAKIPYIGEKLSTQLEGYVDGRFGRLPVEFDADLTEVFALTIEAIQMIGEQEYVDIPEGILSFLDEFEALINSLPKSGKVVIGELPSAIGTYECYALTYSANYKSVMAKAKLNIVPIKITVTMSDKTMTEGDTVPKASYTDDSAAKLLSGHSLSVTGKYTGAAVPAAGTYTEVYDADIICDHADKNGTAIYDITVIKGDLIVNEETVSPVTYNTVTFVDRSSVVKTVRVKSGDTVDKPANPSRSDYTFRGWYLDSKKYDFATPVTDDITLTAKWRYDGDDYIVDDDNDDDDKGTNGELIYLNKNDHIAYLIGYEDGTVRPNGDITRAEVATIYFRLLSDEVRDQFWSVENPYRDVAPTAWYNTAVSTLYNLGVFVDCEDAFRPDDAITRAELAVIAAQFADIDDYERCSFDDVAKKYWAADEIAIVEAMGWIEGYPDGSFRPDCTITRAETVTIINRMLERAVKKENMRDDMVTFSDNLDGRWYFDEIQEAANSHKYKRTTDEVKDYGYCYERWTRVLEAPDWAMIERSWYAKHAA